MSTLLDVNTIPDAPKLPDPVKPVVAPADKPKRKSYYIPVAERHKEKLAAKKQQKQAKKSEADLRDGKDVKIEPNARKRAADRKVVKTVAKTKTKTKTKPVAKKQDVGKGGTGSEICSLCHKPLSRHTSISAGMGDTCAGKIKLLPAGTTMEDHYAKITVMDVPDGYIKLQDAIKKLKEKGISGYRIMQAIGGERMLRKPINSHFKVVFVGNTRYINGSCLKNWKDLEKI